MSGKNTKVNFNLANPVQFLALGFGSGLAPKAPGTFGTLAAVPLFLLMSGLSPLLYGSLVFIVCIAGIYICGKAASDVGVHDHGAIVWDEFAGFFITMFMIPVSWQSVLVGFILFRIFDIAKPWPISVADKKLTGGFGIMFDDVLAGLFALGIMHIIF
ncbi:MULTISPECIES: phosphatidylglycerophosphatase A family protein [Colwellia]|uniref:Phosphatidylglycerophosphatase A n=1 Tax=Colwellia psychrerythraea (strain 34H / ATCC BAA-681) TaxID=167879 RepID=Q485I9_COLP3|nr:MULTISPECIES: phosphatidylglycerophosphatase A [Colwellia]AAZ24993.1 phosphatidylglycerophosphatase A [Colwellia psychrerythraea 34H]PKH88762.1 phosphatidylglycerophosphatase A [Colwellia sp. Bg11-28]